VSSSVVCDYLNAERGDRLGARPARLWHCLNTVPVSDERGSTEWCC
jgi:hypothetical protein